MWCFLKGWPQSWIKHGNIFPAVHVFVYKGFTFFPFFPEASSSFNAFLFLQFHLPYVHTFTVIATSSLLSRFQTILRRCLFFKSTKKLEYLRFWELLEVWFYFFFGLVVFFYFPFYQAFHMALIDTEDECKDGVKLLISQATCENLPTYKICPLI